MQVPVLSRDRHHGQVLRETEERLWATLEYAPVGIAHVDLHGRWQLVNRRLCEILGCRRNELLASQFRDRLDIDLTLAARAIGGKHRSWVMERRYIRKDASEVWCRVAVSGVGDPRPRYYVVTVEDISVRMAADSTLGAAAHELRMPLSHMKGFISSLRRTDTKWDAKTQREFLAEAEHEANRLEDLIEDMLDQSTERAACSRRAIVLPSALVMGCLQRMRAELGDRQVRVDVPTTLPLLEVDATAIEQVLANLLQNADKYSPPETPINVTGRVVGEMLELSVDDCGPGVPAEDFDRIFEPFYRRDVRTQRAKAGHGLGLAICRSTVTAHGGRIWVARRPGGGARFTMALPLMEAASRRTERRLETHRA